MGPNTPTGPQRGLGWLIGSAIRKWMRALSAAPRWTVWGAVAALVVLAGGLYLAAGRSGFLHPQHQVTAPLRQTKPSTKRRTAPMGRSSMRTRSVTAPLALPVSGEVAANYGWVYSTYLGEWYYNPGLTLTAPAGTPVHAAWGGRVESVSTQPYMGLTVTVADGNGMTTVYGHLGQASVAAGQPVQQGTVLGTVGGPSLYSRQQGSHVDFQIWQGNQSVNPENYLNGSS
jgi:murein DD-endopeptidase MepM/ murein hydrolase activator NlpD